MKLQDMFLFILYVFFFVLLRTYSLVSFVGECQILDADVANSQDTN